MFILYGVVLSGASAVMWDCVPGDCGHQDRITDRTGDRDVGSSFRNRRGHSDGGHLRRRLGRSGRSLSAGLRGQPGAEQ